MPVGRILNGKVGVRQGQTRRSQETIYDKCQGKIGMNGHLQGEPPAAPDQVWSGEFTKGWPSQSQAVETTRSPWSLQGFRGSQGNHSAQVHVERPRAKLRLKKKQEKEDQKTMGWDSRMSCHFLHRSQSWNVHPKGGRKSEKVPFTRVKRGGQVSSFHLLTLLFEWFDSFPRVTQAYGYPADFVVPLLESIGSIGYSFGVLITRH